MKKLMIAAAIVCAAAMSQAAAMAWSTGKLYMVDEDGKYTSSFIQGNADVKSFALTAYLYDTDGKTVLDSATKAFADINKVNKGVSGTFTATVDNNKTYYVSLVMSGDFGNGDTQTFLNTDPVAVSIGATGDGSAVFSDLKVIDTTKTQWSAVPEPTSGLLLLLGVAGLALRRRRA